jgi:hypothetical protein
MVEAERLQQRAHCRDLKLEMALLLLLVLLRVPLQQG